MSESFKILVVCPPHLLEKWPREIEEVSREARASKISSISDLIAFRNAVDGADAALSFFAVVSSEMLKLGSGWTGGAARSQTRRVIVVRQDDEGKDSFIQIPAFTCPRCGEIVKMKGGEDEEPVSVMDAELLFSQRLKCLVCNEPLYQAKAIYSRPRWPLSTFIRRKMKRWFDLVIIDEAHEAKGQSTDRGHAVGEVIAAAKKSVALTGTLFGGTASSLFYLLHRLSSDFRQEYSWSDVGRFVERFGVVEKTSFERKERNEGYGRYSGLSRKRQVIRERPGVSPGLVKLLLPNSAFVSLEDLGYKLPPFSEIPVLLEMPDEMASTYRRIESFLHDASHENPRRLGEFLQTTLSWPNATFRPCTIDGLGVIDAAPEGELTPKEKWLVDTVAREIEERRKVLVFLRQTGTRDIQPRLASLLSDAGIRAEILERNVSPAKREAWVNRRLDRIDALICNPKLVQTGLDLIAFSTTIFYEPDYSLYTVQQAARRTWRLGQTKPVRVYYPTYNGTMENRALAIIGKKIVAAQLLYGDDVSAAFAADQGGSLLEELAREAANSEIPNLRNLFATQNEDDFESSVELDEVEDAIAITFPIVSRHVEQLSFAFS